MKGRPDPSKKQRREAENRTALGGMRSPHHTVSRITHTSKAVAKVATLLTEMIDLNPWLLQPAMAILEGSITVGFDEIEITALKGTWKTKCSPAP